MGRQEAQQLGSWIRERRQELGISTVHLARQAGTTDGTITRIEQGAFTAPAPNKLARIAEALHLNLADVYAMAAYDVPTDLPSFQPYLRRKYRDMPPKAFQDLDSAFREIIARHGYDPDGPKATDDEDPVIDPTI